MKRIGYGQVEPNHLSAQRTGQIYAQLPCDAAITVLENGMFVKYDYANKKVALTGDGEALLVYNEVKLYDERKQMTRDFAMKAEDAVDGTIVPRLFKTNIGDIYTTNMLVLENEGEEVTYSLGDKLTPNASGILATATGNEEMIWKIVDEKATMPDGQAAVKIQRIK
jgi:hypothetical protein